MITRFFSTSKPIHLVLISVIVTLLFVAVRFEEIFTAFNLVDASKHLFTLLVLVFSIIVLAFFVTKNNLTKRNSYKIVFYTLLLATLPSTLLFDEVIIANLFIMLALRRIISLRTNTNVKKKLFDAAFWISIAALFYFWSFLFFALILAALFLFSIGNIKNWVIPFLGCLTVAILIVSYTILMENSFGDLYEWIDGVSNDFTSYNKLSYIIAITIILSMGTWALFFYLKTLNDKPKNYRAAHFLVLLSGLLAMVIVVITPDKNGSEFIFLFAPLSIIMSNYIQIVNDSWFGEAFIWLLILTPIATLFL